MKNFLIAILMALMIAPAVSWAQGRVKNPSNVNTMELSQRGGKVMLVQPGKEAVVWFLPEFGETSEKVLVRFFNSGRVVSSYAAHFTIPRNGAYLVPERGIEVRRQIETRKQPVTQQQASSASTQKQQVAVTPGFQPVIPEVTATATATTFPLVLVDSSDFKILVFEGDFYGAALAPGQRTEPSMTKPGMISFKVLYDADPPDSTTGKNIWQAPISGIVTQDESLFVLRNAHLINVQNNMTKVKFYNPTKFVMVSDDARIKPLAPGEMSPVIKINTGFSNMSFQYTNEAGVKVRAVFEIAVSSKTRVIWLNVNPLGSAYGVVHQNRRYERR